MRPGVAILDGSAPGKRQVISGSDRLRELLTAPDLADRERAWAAFIEEHSDLVLRVARRIGGDHDVMMDRYAFVLEALRRDEYQRLRAYLADERGQFTTWLAVVVRRLCLDHHRQRYGRPQGEAVASAERHAERRNLVDLISDELAVRALAAPGGDDPDLELRQKDVRVALEAALAQLTPSERLVLRFRFEEGLSVPEIARITSAGSPFRLYRRINGLLVRLRESLRGAGIYDASP
jgi:RNA polymerase sigma factor (sigma-70 family)